MAEKGLLSFLSFSWLNLFLLVSSKASEAKDPLLLRVRFLRRLTPGLLLFKVFFVSYPLRTIAVFGLTYEAGLRMTFGWIYRCEICVKWSVKVSRPTKSLTTYCLSLSIFCSALSIWIWTIDALLTIYYYAVSSLVLAIATRFTRYYPDYFLLSVKTDSSFFLWLFNASFNMFSLLLSYFYIGLSSIWSAIDDGFL